MSVVANLLHFKQTACVVKNVNFVGNELSRYLLSVIQSSYQKKNYRVLVWELKDNVRA